MTGERPSSFSNVAVPPQSTFSTLNTLSSLPTLPLLLLCLLFLLFLLLPLPTLAMLAYDRLLSSFDVTTVIIADFCSLFSPPVLPILTLLFPAFAFSSSPASPIVHSSACGKYRLFNRLFSLFRARNESVCSAEGGGGCDMRREARLVRGRRRR
jgi:hypothetical protein